MCGIAGYFGQCQISREAVETTLKLMRRRGPDHAAHRSWNNGHGLNAHLLFTRLSIIDLDPRSNQPLQVGRKWIVFNGELYNYLERRADLIAGGRVLTTHSDTEALLGAIDHFGWDVLDQCEGMWAFAVYDEADGSLTLCRDRLGEKPLYLYRDRTGLYFGSEVKFIEALSSQQLRVNLNHIFRYLVNGYKALYKTRETFFTGISELAPGSILRVEPDGTEQPRRYWQPVFRPNDAMTYDDAVAGTRERLIRSVELRLRADVPLAFCMSGGIDSNGLISVAKNVFQYDVHGFTIVNEDARYDEREMVDLAVRQQALRHTVIPLCTERFLEKLRKLVRYHDSPVATITCYAQWLVQESVAQHGYRISVSGTGADELFTGYYDHHLAYLYEIRDDPVRHKVSVKNWERHVKPLVRNPFLSDPDLFIKNRHFRDHIYLNAEEFALCLRPPWREPFAEGAYTPDLLRNRMFNELFHEAVPVILHEDDLNAMYYSVENRSPYLDRSLFEFACQIPTRHLIREGRAKSVLRDALRGVVPDAVLDNPRKVGFNAPIYGFLDVQDAAVRAELLGDSPIFEHVRRDKIQALIRQPELPNSQSKFLFNFLSSKLFLEEFAS